MKKLFFFAAAMCAAVSMNAQLIAFTEAVDKTAFGAKRTFTAGSVTLVADNSKDPSNKMAIEANNAYFGTTLEDAWKGEYRLKTGGKSQTGNGLTLTVPGKGVVKLYARTGKNEATDRNIVLTQDGTEILNVILLESNAVEVEDVDDNGAPKTTKIYPVYTANVVAGDIVITYPVNSVSIYGLEFVAESPTSIENAFVAPKATKMMVDGQMVIVRDGVKYNALGTMVE